MKSNLKSIREKLGLTQDQLAKKTGRSQPCIANYERSARAMKVDFSFAVIELAKKYGIECTLDDLYIK